MQLDPVKPKLKPPGTKRLIYCDVLLSTSAFKINLRRYNLERAEEIKALIDGEKHNADTQASAYTRSHFRST